MSTSALVFFLMLSAVIGGLVVFAAVYVDYTLMNIENKRLKLLLESLEIIEADRNRDN